MRLLSVNVGTPRPSGDRKRKTGIFKEPVLGPVEVGPLGIQDDAVCDKRHHGGRDQAVYLYDVADYAWWSAELGYEVGPGTFGENLTTEGVDVSGLAIGDLVAVGGVGLQITAPRIPCATLERRMGLRGFVARFMAARRPGAYLRVLEAGSVAAGDEIVLQPYVGERVPLLELFDGFPQPHLDEAGLRRHLAAPIAERARAQKEAQLTALRPK